MVDILDQPKTEARFELIPVIFANGEDDDLPGLAAALLNQKVLFDERVYQPGEAIDIVGRTIWISRGLCVIGPDTIPPDHYDPEEWLLVRQPRKTRWINIADGLICCGPSQRIVRGD